MKWGETQNLLSVIIGLNVAYYAFKEMRTPHLTTLKRNVDQLCDDATKRMDDLRIAADKIPNSNKLLRALVKAWLPMLDLQGEVTKLVVGTSSRKFENLLGIPAMFVASIATVLLIVSTVKFEDGLSSWLFWPIVVVGFAPIVGFIVVNYAILWVAEATYEAKYHEYWNFLHLEFDRHLDDHRLAIAEARHDAQTSPRTAMDERNET